MGSAETAAKNTVEPGALVFVAGASGGVGQLVTAKLLERGYRVRALTRSAEKAKSLAGGDSAQLELVEGDCRSAEALQGMIQGVDAVCCCTGTTAFPSKRWDGDNGPEQTDFVGMRNLVQACPKTLARFVMVSSAGVDRTNKFPYLILNLFGVLKFKKMGEQVLESSGLPFTILRPGRLTDGPYTSYDLNTLLQATSGSRRDVQISVVDELNGETSRLAVAEAAVQALALECTAGRKYSLTSNEGDGPGSDQGKWQALFTSV